MATTSIKDAYNANKQDAEKKKEEEQLSLAGSKTEEDKEDEKSLTKAITGKKDEKKEDKPQGIKDAINAGKNITPSTTEIGKNPEGSVQSVEDETPLSDEDEKKLTPYQTQIRTLTSELDRIRGEKKTEREKADRLRLIQGLSNALIKYAAARYGLKHGVDMSQVKGMDMKVDESLKGTLESLSEEAKDIQGKMDKYTSAEEKRLAEELRLKERAEDTKLKKDISAAEIASREKMQKEALEAQAKQQSPEEKAQATAQGKSLADWQTRGKAQYKKNVASLDKAVDLITNQNAWTGGVMGTIPREARTWIAELPFIDKESIQKGIRAEDLVRSVLMQNLRETLGGQFAQREGENLIASNFFAGQNKEEMVASIAAIKSEMDNAAAEKENMLRYKEKHGDLKGYKGQPVTIMGVEYGPDEVFAEIYEEEGITPEAPSKSESGKKKLTGEEQKALEWARANPDNEDAKEILKLLGQ